MRFSYRRYQDGDAAGINELFFKVTGQHRTLEQHAWQWLQSPAGESEMWLIEAELDDGSKKLVGHHGVMAEDFTYRGMQVRVGKTENTMVLPEYREKFLYPRYEKLFLAQYEGRFHALFSTTGPAPAIRLRELMGYEAKHEWVDCYVGVEPRLSIDLIRDRFFPRRANFSGMPGAAEIQGTRVACLNVRNASFDFDAFWSEVAPNYGLTPARTYANLNWRFWSNPYVSHHTLKLDAPDIGTAIAVISFRSGRLLHVDDLYCKRPSDLGRFMTVLSCWARKKLGLEAMSFETTSDCFGYFLECNPRSTSWAHFIAGRGRGGDGLRMPRKLTPLGKSAGIDEAKPWYVTPFFFEGR